VTEQQITDEAEESVGEDDETNISDARNFQQPCSAAWTRQCIGGSRTKSR